MIQPVGAILRNPLPKPCQRCSHGIDNNYAPMTPLQKKPSVPSITSAHIYNRPIHVVWTKLVEMPVIYGSIQRTHCERFGSALMKVRAPDSFVEGDALIRRIDRETNYAPVDQTTFRTIGTQKTMLVEPQTFSRCWAAQDFERPGW